MELASLDRKRVGVSMGTTSGEPREVERFDDLFVARKLGQIGPEFLAKYPSHLITLSATTTHREDRKAPQ